MKKLVYFFVSIAFFFTVSSASAHFRGQPFLKINGEPTKVYTQQEIVSIGDISIPSDIAPGVYLPGKEISFEIDTSVLPFPEEVIKKAKYKWDLGDGTNVEGVKTTHKYAKAGPYEVTVEIDYGDLNEFGFNDPSALPPTYQRVLLNVLPSPEYKLPTPVIFINGKDLKSYQKKIDGAYLPTSAAFFQLYHHVAGIRVAKNFNFDASKSTGTSKVKEYLWDFEDGKKLITSPSTSQDFTNGYYFNSVALRIEDEKGFYAVSFFDVGNKDMEEQKDGEERDESPIISMNVIYGVGIGALLMIVIGISLIFLKLFRSKK